MSQRHPGTRRTKPEGSSEPDDVFIARVLNFGKWAESNQQALTVIGIVLAIGVAGLLYYRNYQGSIDTQAAQQLEIVHQSIAISDREGAKDDLVRFLTNFGGSTYEGEARLLLGQLYLETDDPQQALAVLEPLGTRPSAPIEFQGAALLGAAYEQEERWEDAQRVYLAIADRSDLDFQIRNARTAAARIRANQGDAAGAIELYEEILADLEENAADRGRYEMRIAELNARMGT